LLIFTHVILVWSDIALPV